MSSSIINAESILAIELGSVHTRALLLDVVDGQYRFIAVGTAPNTLQAPYNTILEGVQRAIQNLQEITGRNFLAGNGGLMIPSQINGTGVDRLVLTFSTGSELKIVVTGLLEDVSLQSVEKLAYSTYGRIVEVIGLNDTRRREAQLDAILHAQPNLIIMAGGVEQGASRSVVRMAELVLLMCRILPVDKRPEVLFAGNQALAKKLVEGLQKWAVVHTAPNIRPAIDVENLGPAQDVLAGVVTRMRQRTMSGLQDLSIQCATSPIPAANAFGRMITFLSQIYDPTRGVLGVDVGSQSTILAAAMAGKLALNVFPYGVGSGLGRVMHQSKLDEIAQWLPMHVPGDVVYDYLAQKTIYPASIPANQETLALEQAIARHVMRLAMQHTHQRWPDMAKTFEPILVGGSALRQAPSLSQCMLMVLDGLQPLGMSMIVLDQNGLLPTLGAVAKFNSLLPVQVLESGAFVNLGWVISPISDARYGTPILQVRLEPEGGEETRYEIRQGTLTVLPLKAGQKANIHFHPLRKVLLDPGRTTAATSYKIIGGICGAVIDARGRPISLPNDAARRRDLLKKWAAAFIA